MTTVALLVGLPSTPSDDVADVTPSPLPKAGAGAGSAPGDALTQVSISPRSWALRLASRIVS